MSEKIESAQAAARPAPTLTIGLPVYNGQKYLESALASLAAQTFTDYEVVICDNASTDRTAEICAAAVDRDPRIRYVRNPTNLGVMGNFDRAAELATGELFMWAAHDDLWEPRFIERMVGALRANPQAGLAYCNYDWVDDHGRSVGQGKMRFIASRPSPLDRLLTFNASTPNAYNFLLYYAWRNPFLVYGMFRTAALRRVLPFQYIFPDARHVDNIMMLRFLAREKAVAVDELLFHYRAKNRESDESKESYKAPRATGSEPENEAEVERVLKRHTLEVISEVGFGPLESRLMTAAVPALSLLRAARARLDRR